MGSDRARVSYDPSRHWRQVVAQQGRVTLEADWNEEAAIAAEARREALIDVIGPAGTPDDGYRVVPAVDANGNATGDLTIGAGTMYAGGERMVLDADLDYASQPDWIDTAGDPLWARPAVPDGLAHEYVYLLLHEQEVGAVEDPALLDVALGGPDTAERLRIVQRVVRTPIDGNTCADGLAALESSWARHGLAFDPATMRLEPASSLQVSFGKPRQAPTLCDPVAQGGYLGADNQLIRVQVASVDAETGKPALVWGFDNAHFLHRVTVGAVAAGPPAATVLTLANAPVDAYHQPAAGQAVEVLGSAAWLTAADYVAAATGIVTTVAAAYQPDTRQLSVATALGAPATDSPQLYLRVWQELIPAYGGGPVDLGTTGVQVTLSSSTGVYHPGDYWTFAVRPGTPTAVSPVYPQRILDAPQPPDGARMWACPLAVVAWAKGVPTVADCRRHFDGLVTLTGLGGGCCVEVSPERVGGGARLQALIDRHAGRGPTTICLKPGVYQLPKPLAIGAGHAGLTIRACGPGVVIEAAGPSRDFLLGLVQLEAPRSFALRGVELRLAEVPLQAPPAALRAAIAALPEERRPLLLAYLRGVRISIGVHARGGTGVTIEGCTFTFASSEAEVFAAGVFAAGVLDGLRLAGNVFSAPAQENVPFASLALRREAEGPRRILGGYVQLPARVEQVQQRARRQETAAESEVAPPRIALPALADAAVEANLFEGLTVPVLVLGRLGFVRIEDNSVRACYGGFWLLHTATAVPLALIERAASANDAGIDLIGSSGLVSLVDPVLLLATVLARILPLVTDAHEPAGSIGSLTPPTKTILIDAEKAFRKLWSVSAGVASQAHPAPAPAAAPAAAGFPQELERLFTPVSSPSRYRQFVPADTGTAIEPRLEVSGNQVDAVLAGSDSGAGLLVLVFDAAQPSSLVCSDNRIRSRAPSAAAASLWELLECTVTGNIVANEAGGKLDRSLVLVPRVPREVAAVAVTGNVLIGLALLPGRPGAAPFDTWDGLNTLMTTIS